MFEGIKYKRGKNRPYLIPEIHLLSVWADIIDNRQERIKFTDRLDDLYAKRKRAIDTIDPELLLIEYPADKQDAADRYNEGKLNAKELMDLLIKTPKWKYETKAEYDAYEKAMEQIREKESDIFKGRKIYCYGWNGNGQEYAKKIERLTSWANDIMQRRSWAGRGEKDSLAEGYIQLYKKTGKTTKEKEEKEARNIQKIMLKEKDRKTAAICGADHYLALYTMLGAKTTNETDSLYHACAEFNSSKKTREQAYERALALGR